VNGILADVNIEGYVDSLAKGLQTDTWRLFWDSLDLRYAHFQDVDLAPSASDDVVWSSLCEPTPSLCAVNPAP
jgi:hypothetical protein